MDICRFILIYLYKANQTSDGAMNDIAIFINYFPWECSAM